MVPCGSGERRRPSIQIFEKLFDDRKKVKSLYTKISFSKTQVLFCNFRVMSAMGFWTEFSVLSTRKTEKRELYYHNFLTLMRDTSAENIGKHIFYYIWYTRNTSDSITIFGPYRSVLRDIWGTRKNTWKMEILPVKRNKSLGFQGNCYRFFVEDFFDVSENVWASFFMFWILISIKPIVSQLFRSISPKPVFSRWYR